MLGLLQVVNSDDGALLVCGTKGTWVQILSHLPRQQGQIVFHWFTGSKSEAQRAVYLGCYFSINTAMLRCDRGRNLVATLPVDRLLTETDTPLTRIDNRPTEPTDVKAAVESLATTCHMTPEDLTRTIQSNRRFLLEGTGVSVDD